MSTSADDLIDSVAENATKPASASEDGRSASQHNLRDQIEAARFLAEREATQRSSLPVRLFKTRPPGAQ